MESTDKILSLIHTQDEANDILVVLNEFLASLYSTKEVSLEDHFSRLPKDLSYELQQAIKNEDLIKSKDALREFISQLQDNIKACKSLKATLAFQPDNETITVFSTWAKKNIGSNVLLDIEINKEIVGGAVIIVDGQYRDYSVRKKLAQVFQIQKEEIMSLLSEAH
jgi:F0F1-type ATP synthase delta subunit